MREGVMRSDWSTLHKLYKKYLGLYSFQETRYSLMLLFCGVCMVLFRTDLCFMTSASHLNRQGGWVGKMFRQFCKTTLASGWTLKQLDLFRAGFIYCITFYRLHFVDDFSLIMKIIFLLAIRFYVVTFARVHMMNTKMTFEHSGTIFNVWYILADKRT